MIFVWRSLGVGISVFRSGPACLTVQGGQPWLCHCFRWGGGVFWGVSDRMSEFWTNGIVYVEILTISIVCLTQFDQTVNWLSFEKTLFQLGKFQKFQGREECKQPLNTFIYTRNATYTKTAAWTRSWGLRCFTSATLPIKPIIFLNSSGFSWNVWMREKETQK